MGRDSTTPATGESTVAEEIEIALGTVRWLLGGLAVVVLLVHDPLTRSRSWATVGVLALAITVALVALNGLFQRLSGGPTWAAILTQGSDIVAFAALSLVLDDALGGVSWILILVPTVGAAVRHGALASLLTWAAGLAAWFAGVGLGLVRVDYHGPAWFLDIPGALLSVALAVGILVRWTREGWLVQRRLTDLSAAREARLRALEQATHHIMGAVDPAFVVKACVEATVDLGFGASSLSPSGHATPTLSAGSTNLIGLIDPDDPAHRSGTALVTRWRGDDGQSLYSVTSREPSSGAVVVGWSAKPIENDQAQAFLALMSVTTDRIETVTLINQLRFDATHDPLTGLLNRRTLDQELQALSSVSGQLGVIFFDVDNFKSVNDQYGHQAGDAILKMIGDALRSVAGDRAARFGGDEFVVLVPDGDLECVRHLAQEIQDRTRSPFDFGRGPFAPSVSIGIAVSPTPTTPEDVLDMADRATLQAKAAGKNTIASAWSPGAAERPTAIRNR